MGIILSEVKENMLCMDILKGSNVLLRRINKKSMGRQLKSLVE